MLVLSRKIGESILIGNDIEVQVVRIEGSRVRIAIRAPRETTILRDEIAERYRQLTNPGQDGTITDKAE